MCVFYKQTSIFSIAAFFMYRSIKSKASSSCFMWWGGSPHVGIKVNIFVHNFKRVLNAQDIAEYSKASESVRD